jgi:nicotinamidase/pyrazinamidase
MKALIVVDCQYDFMPGGSLEVKDGDKIIPLINSLLPLYPLVIFTKDWHPADHKSFASQHEGKNVFDLIDLNGQEQVLWPDHCVQGTPGADIHKDIDFSLVKTNFYIFKKGMDKEVDSYSAFYDNGGKNSTGLSEFLMSKGIDAVDIVGLTTDFCCKFTALDAKSEGFKTTMLLQGTRGIAEDLMPTIEELRSKDINVI